MTKNYHLESTFENATNVSNSAQDFRICDENKGYRLGYADVSLENK